MTDVGLDQLAPCAPKEWVGGELSPYAALHARLCNQAACRMLGRFRSLLDAQMDLWMFGRLVIAHVASCRLFTLSRSRAPTLRRGSLA
jgi:hypothetical protein